MLFRLVTHILTWHYSTQSPLASDWLGATPAGLDPRQLQRTCTDRHDRQAMSHTLTRHCSARGILMVPMTHPTGTRTRHRNGMWLIALLYRYSSIPCHPPLPFRCFLTYPPEPTVIFSCFFIFLFFLFIVCFNRYQSTTHTRQQSDCSMDLLYVRCAVCRTVCS